MNKLFYKISYIDLKPSIDVIFNNIKTRTEIRKAKKSDVKVKIFQNHVDDYIIRVCSGMLKRTLKREYVPYSSVFDSILRDKNNVLMIALLDDKIISFISLSLKAELEFFKNKKTAFLSLSSTDNEYKKYCPNYLLVWEAINFLKENDFVYFNLGLLNYVGCPDPDIERVAFFKKKWGGEEMIVRDDGGLLKLIYYRFFKRFKIFKFFIYYFKKILVWKK